MLTRPCIKFYRNNLTHIIRFSKRSYFYDIFNNINATWNTINGYQSRKKNNTYLTDIKNGNQENNNENDIASNLKD